ncbi:Protein retinal degeneration B [Araneus ventricosus]|uniref:Protein retinal degeneration B n=1 Tax=Araneus ventricosus TaxID=182803 RepID=A0A4Y2UVL0_ARAVE|nr:Protein retinal degeneration B [Araneus ventricosus]
MSQPRDWIQFPNGTSGRNCIEKFLRLLTGISYSPHTPPTVPKAISQGMVFSREDIKFSNSYIKKVQSEHARVRPPIVGSACPATRTILDTSLPSTPTASPAHQSSCTTTVLALAMHAGSVLYSCAEPTPNKKTDVNTFATSFETVMRQHYPALLGHLSVRLISCAPVCSEALAVLSK